MKKIKVGILGATGAVGQRFIQLLENHPYFEITFLLASEKSSGKKYSRSVSWKLKEDIPEKVKDLKVYSIKDDIKKLTNDVKILFSGLDSSIALDIEKTFLKIGKHVVSNSKNHRMLKDVPLLIPEINHEHINLIYSQKEKGKIITNPNCSTTFFTLVAGILNKKWPLKAISVTTMQAISGAGYPGLPSYDIINNVIPYISGEEEKMETEPLKILGLLNNNSITYADIKISSSANRVAVIDGHLESLSLSFKNISPNINDIKKELSEFISPLYKMNLPSAVKYPVKIFDTPDRPQTRLDVNRLNGMGISVGRIRKDNIFDVKMTVLGHNTIEGASGGAILNAELLAKKLSLI
jgi:aspartate-semialdehyde dehydrogenase